MLRRSSRAGNETRSFISLTFSFLGTCGAWALEAKIRPVDARQAPGAFGSARRLGYAAFLPRERSMRTIRLHIDQALNVGAELALPAQASEHAVRVLRMVAGDPLTLFNGDGCDYAATIVAVSKREVTVRIDAKLDLTNESPLALTLAQGVARGDKMDLIVQKATELGVTRIVPLLTERSEVKLDAARSEKRLLHWRAVAASACEQSGRARVPEITAAVPLAKWLDELADDGALRLALLPEAARSTRELRFGVAGGVLVVGPEGGLGERDISALYAATFEGLALGPRILRTETAGLAALAALQAIHGDA
jgi:16S rRNA (uracil1498-N3)-methyltransferase